MKASVRAMMLLVRNLDEGVRRYTTAFGLTHRRTLLDSEEGGSLGTNVAILSGEAEIWLLDEAVKPAPYPVLFLGVADVEVARRDAEAVGFKVVPWNGKELLDDPLGRYYILEDPDGNQLEIREPEKPVVPK